MIETTFEPEAYRLEAATSEACPVCEGEVMLATDALRSHVELACGCGAVLVLC